MSQKLRLPPSTTEADRTTITTIKALADYAPRNPVHTVEALLALDAALRQADEAEARARLAYENARREAAAAALALHNATLGARVEVRSQYGPDSSALHAVGLKPRAEYKRPVRRPGPKA